MINMKLLIVEDEESVRKDLTSSIKRYNREFNHCITYDEAENLQEALEKLDNTFDGALIDLNLNDDTEGGNAVIKAIRSANIRIPLTILSGTPSGDDHPNVTCHTKGEVTHDSILNEFKDIHNSGMTKVLGARGEIESLLNRIYEDNILEHKSAWIKYGKADPERSEKSLLRHTLNHIVQLVDTDQQKHFPEEFYICPPIKDHICTGSIVKSITGHERFVVLTPSCDLVPRGKGKPKTDKILCVEIQNDKLLLSKITSLINDNDIVKRKKKVKEATKNFYKNNSRSFYHWLPNTNFFSGGVINFRSVRSIDFEDFYEAYEKPELQISNAFIKDILSRYSSYYARQGQPEIDIDYML